MSQPTKRDADTAFELPSEDQPPSAKRRRNRQSRASRIQDGGGIDGAETEKATKSPTAASTAPNSSVKSTSRPLAERIEDPRSTQTPSKKSTPVKNRASTPDGTLTALVSKPSEGNTPHGSSRRKAKEEKRRRGGWSVSDSKGGVFLDQDPVLTPDAQHLILPTHSEVQVYSARTSLLVRSLQPGSAANVVSCALSTRDPHKLFVANASGVLSVWNWHTGKCLKEFVTNRKTEKVIPWYASADYEAVLLLQRDDVDGIETLEAYGVSSTNFIERGPRILKRLALMPTVKACAEGKILVASAEDKLMIGYSARLSGTDVVYTWRELTLAGPITSFDVQTKPNAKTSRVVPILDVAVGLESGIILAYQDLLYALIGKEKNTSDEDLIGRKLHWHRTAVNTVRWSRDRNYIISGGNETVLVIWQLDTNQKQFLPHLSTAVLGLTVSASGSAYALQLADNSVMILSTADLVPSTSVSGLALPLGSPTADSPVLLHPHSANTLLAAVPSNIVGHSSSATILQTYDIPSSRQLARQALTRNMITAISSAPSGQSVVEPSVTRLSISPDGTWLATVDEWIRNPRDLAEVYLDSDPPSSRPASVETTLRFWVWSEESQNWELVTRVDEPHTPGPSALLGLAANPSKSEFATIGADGNLHTWTPRARHKNGVPVRGARGETLYTWSRRLTVTSPDEPGKDAPTTAALAYSSDGSTIAASWYVPASTTPRLTHFISSANGSIAISQPDLVSKGDAKLAFLGRQLFCLSRVFTVFDPLTASTTCSIGLDLEQGGQRYLAVNNTERTAAVAVSRSFGPQDTLLLVLGVTDDTVTPVFEKRFDGPLKALIASTTTPGYVIIDDKSRVKTLKRSGLASTSSLSAAATKESEIANRSLDSIFGREAIQSADDDDAAPPATITDTEATPAMKLDDVLRIDSSRDAPGPEELFRRVLGVLGRRAAPAKMDASEQMAVTAA